MTEEKDPQGQDVVRMQERSSICDWLLGVASLRKDSQAEVCFDWGMRAVLRYTAGSPAQTLLTNNPNIVYYSMPFEMVITSLCNCKNLNWDRLYMFLSACVFFCMCVFKLPMLVPKYK